MSSHGTSSFRSGRGGPNRGRGQQVRFGGLNVVYDEDENTYPVDNAGQLYVLLEYVQIVAEGETEVENLNQTKN